MPAIPHLNRQNIRLYCEDYSGFIIVIDTRSRTCTQGKWQIGRIGINDSQSRAATT